MQPGKILKAAVRIRNIALLGGVLIVSYLTGYLPFLLIGLAGYVYFVIQTLKDSRFLSECSNDEKISSIQQLSTQCDELFRRSRKSIDRQALTKVKNIMQDKDEIMELFSRDEQDFVKQKVVEQAVKLAMAYISLMAEYSSRRREAFAIDAREVISNINNNTQRLRFLSDAQAIENTRQAIEMDRKVLDKIEQDRTELDRISSRLTFIESTMTSFKHQTITSDNSDEASEEIENIINESQALDNVLNDNRKESLRKIR